MAQSVFVDGFGGAEMMRTGTIDDRMPGAGEVRVAVRAAGVNPIDYKIRNGWLSSVFPSTFPYVPGSEVAGVVDAIGAGVEGVLIGDDVVAIVTGGYATSAIAAVETVFAKPEGLSFVDAAAFPVAAEVGYRTMLQLGVSAGDVVVINGAGGPAGSAAAQFAIAWGATVIGIVSRQSFDWMRSIGATAVKYGDGVVGRVAAVAPNGVDALLDCAGKGNVAELVAIAGDAGKVITIADMSAPSYGVRFSGEDPGDRHLEGVNKAFDLWVEGRMRIPVAATFALDQAAEALALSESGRAGGKLVLTVGAQP